MYVSTSQVILSLERLKDLHPFFGYAFFAFKEARMPVGETAPVSYSVIKEHILERYFHPIESYPGYFNPFKSNKSWVSSRYDSTSLQRIVADTFSDAFIYKKGSGERGWKNDYVDILGSLMAKLKSSRISLLDLTVWLYRDDGNIPNEADAVAYLIRKAIAQFHITPEEAKALFNPHGRRAISVSAEAPDLNEVWNIVGWPDGFRDEGGVTVEHLNLLEVGPATDLGYFPREHLNIVTGDNSLGKTFLLDCVWWSLTGAWWMHEAEPRRSSRSQRAEIAYGLKTSGGRVITAEATYNRLDEDWQRPADQHEGIGIYATHSGAFALWDPVRAPNESNLFAQFSSHLVLNRDQVWEGLKREDNRGRSMQVLNGLIYDWIAWQASDDRYATVLSAFEKCVRALSPPDGPPLRAGRLASLVNDSRDFPTIKMPYGDVPVIYASAGVQRILALAYVLVWHWNEHTLRCAQAKRAPFKRMVVIVDEIEAHLHPRWQRSVLPALLDALQIVAPGVEVQLHISTHSPLVLTSVEPEIDEDRDAIHHLALEGANVSLSEFDVVKHGTVDAWLESDIFGLSSARSIVAEKLIEQAKALQLARRPSQRDVRATHRQLLRALPDDDPFWVRWLYFAEQRGVEGPNDTSRPRA
jgi:hypothetical protein